MSVNYATKYSQLVDERFSQGSLTALAVNNDYDWTGVRTLKVYSLPTVPMNDYTPSGAERYGSSTELSNSVQELTVRRDRSFTFTIDRASVEDAMHTGNAGAALRRQLDEVVIPEIDKYRLAVLCGNAQALGMTPASAATAYESLLDADVALSEKGVPPFGRVAFVSPTFYKYIKLDSAFVKQGDAAQELVKTGAVGMVDNVAIVRVPGGYLPSGVQFVMTHPSAAAAAQKLNDYKIHDNPPGINGFLVEGRVCYDAFVLSSKKDAIYVSFGQMGELAVNCKAADAGKTMISADIPDGRLYYKTGSSVTLPAFGTEATGYAELPKDGVITATNGHKVGVVLVIGGKVASGGVGTAVTI